MEMDAWLLADARPAAAPVGSAGRWRHRGHDGTPLGDQWTSSGRTRAGSFSRRGPLPLLTKRTPGVAGVVGSRTTANITSTRGRTRQVLTCPGVARARRPLLVLGSSPMSKTLGYLDLARAPGPQSTPRRLLDYLRARSLLWRRHPLRHHRPFRPQEPLIAPNYDSWMTAAFISL